MKRLALAIASRWSLLVVRRPRRRRVADDFFSSSPGAADGEPRRARQPGPAATTATSTARKRRSRTTSASTATTTRTSARGSPPARASTRRRRSRARSARPATTSTRARGYDLMGWTSIKGGEKGFDHDLTGWPLNGKHAATDCDECHKTKNKQGLKIYMGTDRLCGSPAATTTISRTSSSARTCSRASAATARACGSRRRRSLAVQPRRPQGRGDAAARLAQGRRVHASATRRACSTCRSPRSRQLRQHRLSPEPARRPPVRPKRVRVVPLADVQDAQAAVQRDMPFFDHTRADAVRPRRAQEAQVLRLPHQGARRAASRSARASSATRRTTSTAIASTEFGKPLPKCSTCHPTSGEWKPNAFNHGSRTKFTLTGKHARRSRAASVTAARARPTSRTSTVQTGCMECHEHKKVHADTDHPNGKYNDQAVPRAATRPAASIEVKYDKHRRSSITARTRTSRSSRSTRTCRATTATPAARRRARRRSRRSPASAARAVPRGLAAQGHARREVHAVPLLGHVGRAQVRSQRQPFPDGTGKVELPAQGRAQEQQVRVVPRREAQVHGDAARRAPPRAATPTTTRTRAGSATSARSATSRPATTSSTTTR